MGFISVYCVFSDWSDYYSPLQHLLHATFVTNNQLTCTGQNFKTFKFTISKRGVLWKVCWRNAMDLVNIDKMSTAQPRLSPRITFFILLASLNFDSWLIIDLIPQTWFFQGFNYQLIWIDLTMVLFSTDPNRSYEGFILKWSQSLLQRFYSQMIQIDRKCEGLLGFFINHVFFGVFQCDLGPLKHT